MIKNFELYLAAKPAAATYVSKNTAAGVGSNLNFSSASTKYGAAKFFANGIYTPRRITLSLKKTGSPTGTIQAFIWENSSTSPGALLISSTETVDVASLTTGYQDIDFDIDVGDSAELSNGGTYWVGVYGPGWISNYLQWSFLNTGTGVLKYAAEPNVGWTPQDNDMTANYTVWSLE